MSEKYKTIIKANSPWKPFDFKEILRYKDMFYFKSLNSYKAQQRQTVLSYIWIFVDPVVNIIFFSVVFGHLAKISLEGSPYDGMSYTAFNAAAMAGWIFMRTGLARSPNSLVEERNLLDKVYFPRIFIPIIPTIVNLPNFLIQLVCTQIVLAYFGHFPSWNYWAIIPILLCMVIYSVALGLFLTTFMLQFRDLPRIWGYIMQYYVYTLPLAYPLTNIPEKYAFLYLLNPGVSLIEGFRAALLGVAIPWGSIGISLSFSLFLLYVGAVIFRHKEPNIVDAL
tara:strand:- start:18286 stop:19125 length:840 start_codon:yes stop_codon:yes gene_type:complete